MKKFAITLCILGSLGLTSGAFASFQAEDMATVPSIQSEGFSKEMSKVTDVVRYNHSKGTVDTYYNHDPYADCNGSDKLKWYSFIKRWFDPNQDDEMFGRHNINFSNEWGWMEGDMPAVSTKKVKEAKGEVEDVNVDQVIEEEASTTLDEEIDSL